MIFLLYVFATGLLNFIRHLKLGKSLGAILYTIPLLMNNGTALVAGELDSGPQLVRQVDPLDARHDEQQAVEEGGEDAADGDHDAQVAAVARPGRLVVARLETVARRGDPVGQRPSDQGPEDRRERRHDRDRADLIAAQAHRQHVQRQERNEAAHSCQCSTKLLHFYVQGKSETSWPNREIICQ